MNEDTYLKTINRLLTTVERVAAPVAVQGATLVSGVAGSSLLDTALASAKANILAGKKTYLVSVLGLVATGATAGVSYMNGDLSSTGLLAAIGGAVVSSGIGTLRAAIARNQGEQAAMLFDALQGVAAQIVQAQAAHAAEAAKAAVAAQAARDDGRALVMTPAATAVAQALGDAGVPVPKALQPGESMSLGSTEPVGVADSPAPAVVLDVKLAPQPDGTLAVAPQPSILASVVDHLPAWSTIKGVPKIGG